MIMDLSNLLEMAHCRVDQRFFGKEACLGDLARRAAASLKLEPGPILEALRHRESLGSTGLGGGVALPHARLTCCSRPLVLITRLREAIPFDAVDNKPVDIVCLVLLPGAKGGDQLNVLASIARRLRDKNIITKLRSAPDGKALHALLTREP